MLKHTFTVLPCVGTRLERHIWRQGIFTWEEFLSTPHISGISKQRKVMFDNELALALHALSNNDINYFASRLYHNEHWRLFDAFRDDIVCLDIETTGGPAHEGAVTMVGLYSKKKMHTLIKDINLDPLILSDILSRYKLIITYYGQVFDIPFIQRAMPGISMRMPNFDLCPAAHRLRIKGGLKKLEIHFGIRRDDAVAGMDGHDAVMLWRRYTRGDNEALEQLIKYNEADTKNLSVLAEIIYNMLHSEYGPGGICLPRKEKRGQIYFRTF